MALDCQEDWGDQRSVYIWLTYSNLILITFVIGVYFCSGALRIELREVLLWRIENWTLFVQSFSRSRNTEIIVLLPFLPYSSGWRHMPVGKFGETFCLDRDINWMSNAWSDTLNHPELQQMSPKAHTFIITFYLFFWWYKTTNYEGCLFIGSLAFCHYNI